MRWGQKFLNQWRIITLVRKFGEEVFVCICFSYRDVDDLNCNTAYQQLELSVIK